MARLLAQVSEWLCGDFHRVGACFRVLHGLWNVTLRHKSECKRYNKHPEWLRQLLQAFFFHCSLSLPSVSREALREKSVGDRDCIYSAAREYVQLPLPSDSPPPLATAAGLDPAVVGRFKNFCHNKAHCITVCTLKLCIHDGSPTFVVVSFLLKICLFTDV